jgi:hypothetical protein
VDKADLTDLPDIVELVATRHERFIIFCDDLSFEEGEAGYKALKVALDGSIAAASDNVLIYATSNRRHLLPEKMSDNASYRHTEMVICIRAKRLKRKSLYLNALVCGFRFIRSGRMTTSASLRTGCAALAVMRRRLRMHDRRHYAGLYREAHDPVVWHGSLRKTMQDNGRSVTMSEIASLNKRPIDVAVGILMQADGDVLMAQRPSSKPYEGYWEFPGGKVEAGECAGCAETGISGRAWRAYS